jgi:hypothetical protein
VALVTAGDAGKTVSVTVKEPVPPELVALTIIE